MFSTDNTIGGSISFGMLPRYGGAVSSGSKGDRVALGMALLASSGLKLPIPLPAGAPLLISMTLALTSGMFSPFLLD